MVFFSKSGIPPKRIPPVFFFPRQLNHQFPPSSIMKKIQTNKATHVKTLVQLQLTASWLLFVEVKASMVVFFFSRTKTYFSMCVWDQVPHVKLHPTKLPFSVESTCLLETLGNQGRLLRHPQSLQWCLEKAPVSARATHSCHLSPVWQCQKIEGKLNEHVEHRRIFEVFSFERYRGKNTLTASNQVPKKMRKRFHLLSNNAADQCRKSGRWSGLCSWIAEKDVKNVFVLWELTPETIKGPQNLIQFQPISGQFFSQVKKSDRLVFHGFSYSLPGISSC